MRAALLSIVLMIIAAVMVGCGDPIIPCTDAADCVIDGHDVGMVCNDQVSPQQRCEEMFGWMDGLDIPPIIDCTSKSTDPGVCEFPMPSF